MAVDRRTFLKYTSLAALTIASGQSFSKALGQTGPEKIVAPGDALKAGRWALVIDARKFMASKEAANKCVLACNRSHNVPNMPEKKDEVKWLWNEPFKNAFPNQHHARLESSLLHGEVLTLCNHCERPPCVRVCPTKATFKRPDGIVAMDQHRCIGCRFCIAACPYGARSFNWKDPRPHIPNIDPNYPTRTKGVVEKCNFCSERLARGQTPACVEAAPPGALVFGDLKDENSAVTKLLRENYSIRRRPELGTMPGVYYLLKKTEL